MTGPLEKLAANEGVGCALPATRRRWATRALGAALLVLSVAFGEVKLIEQASAAGASCGVGAQDGLVRIVDSSLASGFAPLAILR